MKNEFEIRSNLHITPNYGSIWDAETTHHDIIYFGDNDGNSITLTIDDAKKTIDALNQIIKYYEANTEGNPKGLHINYEITASELKDLCNQLEKELGQKPMVVGSVEFMREYECKWISDTEYYKGVIDQIEYIQETLSRCKEIITDKNEINKLNKLYIRINSINNTTYDIMGKIEDLQES